jgi:hypothetical protein
VTGLRQFGKSTVRLLSFLLGEATREGLMGIAYRNSAELSVAVWVGVISDEEADEYFAVLAADPDWAKQGRVLTDLTGLAEESRPSDARIAHTAEFFRSRMSQRTRAVQWAMVADITFEEATRFGEALADEAPRLIVFNDHKSACTWLGVSLAEVQATIEELRREAERNDA